MHEFRNLRKLAGITQHQLAKRTGVDRSKLSLVETGQLHFNADEARKVRGALLSALKKRRDKMDKLVNVTGGANVAT